MNLHTRIRPGQLWQANRRDYLRAVRIVSREFPNGIGVGRILADDVLAGRRVILDARKFTTGVRGWSLLKEAV